MSSLIHQAASFPKESQKVEKLQKKCYNSKQMIHRMGGDNNT